MAFDYEANTEVDVLSVADAIRSSHRLAPLTDEQKFRRQIEIEAWREEQAWASERREAERERLDAEQEAIARHEAAIEQAEANRKARLERQEQISRQVRERELADLRFQSTQHRAWQNNVENAARNAVAVRQRQALIADIESHFNPPPPPPEPITEVVVVSEEEAGSPHLGDRDFNAKLWMQKPRRWW
jgi:hypothetical protein